uniref:F-box domain-containing protein n=1 Tax=Caenorhabditis tropicalis TaxID=1561998 RepID=A0A1I7TGQ4_9PELO
MTDLLDNIVEKTENLKIEEPKFEKWNELPPEMKLECMKTLDFTTRWSLYNTSHTERALVDSQKVKTYKMILQNEHSHMRSHALLFTPRARDPQTGRYYSPKYSRFVLEHAVFESLEFSRITKDLSDFLPSDRVISVKNLKINCDHEEDALYLLERVNDQLDSLVINVGEESLEKILSIPQVANTLSVQLSGISSPQAASELAQIWIDENKDIGKEFKCFTRYSKNFEGFTTFAEKFSNSITSKTDRFIRIRTNNEEKHILLQLGTSTFGILDGTEEFLRMSVISSQQSEIDTSEEWVHIMAETTDNEASSDEDDFYDYYDDHDYGGYYDPYSDEEYYHGYFE